MGLQHNNALKRECQKITNKLIEDDYSGSWYVSDHIGPDTTLVFCQDIDISFGLSALEVEPLGSAELRELIADRLIEMYECFGEFCEDRIATIKENR